MSSTRADGPQDGGPDHGDSLLDPGGTGWVRQRRWRLSVRLLIPLAIIVVLVIGVLRPLTRLTVTGMSASQVGQFRGCHQHVLVRGDIVTNGRAGTVSYQWTWPDGTTSAVVKVKVATHQTSSPFRTPFTFPRSENTGKVYATLKVLAPNSVSVRVPMFYSCTTQP